MLVKGVPGSNSVIKCKLCEINREPHVNKNEELTHSTQREWSTKLLDDIIFGISLHESFLLFHFKSDKGDFIELNPIWITGIYKGR